MLSQEDRDKVAKLPAWARQLIGQLENDNKPAIEEAVKGRREVASLREKNARLRDGNEALIELLRRAGMGGLDWAAKVVEVLEGYSIFKEGSG